MSTSLLKKAALYGRLWEEADELACLINIARKAVLQAALLRPTLEEISSRPGRQAYHLTSSEAQVLNQHRELVQEVRVICKALHEWINHVNDALQSDQVLKKKLDDQHLSHLSRIVLFRNKLITHKELLSESISATSYSADLATLSFMATDFNLHAKAGKEIGELYQNALSYIPTSERSDNTHQRFRLLAKYHAALLPTMMARVKKMVETYGGQSDSLVELAAFCATLTAAVLSPLARELAPDKDQ
ncbi:MAG: hypothetical protein IDH49_14965 [Gammaproteobacteria bacterium]|nr:hypothetical protein [Gammaproteobacteria bacterium]